MVESIQDILKNEKKFNQLAKLAFDSVDKDQNGQIDYIEFEEILGQLAEDLKADIPSKEDIEAAIKYLDKDNSGEISFKEFKQLVKDVLESMTENEQDF